jgi:hypothetical protein
MKDFGLREKIIGQRRHPFPREAVLLAAAPQRAQPEALDMADEGAECRVVSRHGMVGEVAPNNLRQPTPLFGDRLVHPPSCLLLDLPELYPQAIASGLAFKLELTRARTPAFAVSRCSEPKQN